MLKYDYLGFGLGLRPVHYDDILQTKPAVDWFECITEDYLVAGGNPLYYLHKIRELYPIVMHGVSLSIGSVDPLNQDYLRRVKSLAKELEPAWISDHLCWTGVDGVNLHDLMPLPYTEEALQHVVLRIRQVQDFLGRRLVIENVSSYVTYKESTMSEWEFLSAVAEVADCLILLDINNIYVSAFNHHFDPLEYLNAIPAARVQQFHLAGHEHCGSHKIDTHDREVIGDVWDLYAKACQRFGKVSAMIERDADIPPLPELLAELEKAKEIANEYTLELAGQA